MLKFITLIIAIISPIVAALIYFCNKKFISKLDMENKQFIQKLHDNKMSDKEINTIVETYFEFYNTSKASGISALIKSGLSNLNNENEVKKVIDIINSRSKKHPLGGHKKVSSPNRRVMTTLCVDRERSDCAFSSRKVTGSACMQANKTIRPFLEKENDPNTLTHLENVHRNQLIPSFGMVFLYFLHSWIENITRELKAQSERKEQTADPSPGSGWLEKAFDCAWSVGRRYNRRHSLSTSLLSE